MKITSKDLAASLSHERMSHWTEMAGGDPERGLLLHRRNTLVSALVFLDLQILEIALRNRFDAELCKDFTIDWPDHPKLGGHPAVREAKKRGGENKKTGKKAKHDKIIINLSIGFWVDLTNHSTFKAAVSRAFPASLTNEMRAKLDRLKELRNHIAHLEPVIDLTGERLRADFDALKEALDALDPVLAKWALDHSQAKRAVDAGLSSCKNDKALHVQFHVR